MTKLKNYGIITGNTLNTSFGFDEESTNCIKLKELLRNYFSNKNGIYYSTCQAGLGIYCGEEVLKSNNQLLCVTPYENQPEKWTADFRERYFTLHEFSADVKTISINYTENCEENAEKFIVESCDEIIFVTSTGEKFPESIEAAKKLSKTVTVINCDDLTIKVNNI